jgi:hypothetical protein
MGMGAKAFPTLYPIVVEDAEDAELDPLRVVVTGKTEGEEAVEPAMIGVAPGVCFM